MNYGWRIHDRKDAVDLTHAALDMGINFVDTANVYGGKEKLSEKWLGEAIKDRREDVVLATKFWAGAKAPGETGGSRVHIMKAVEASLERLGTDYIDLYIMHRAEKDGPNAAPIEETLSALTDLVRQGKVRYVGTSNFAAWRLAEAQLVSELHGFETFCSDQLLYSLLERFVESEVLRVCRKYRIGVTVYGPLQYGLLSGKYHRGEAPPAGSRGSDKAYVNLDRPGTDRQFDIIEKVTALAEERGLTLPQFSLAWLLMNDVVSSLICGPRTLEHLEDCVKAEELTLDADAMAAVDEINPPPKPHGEWW
jgi:aryl-alcohol dehydrogenase-like predicted oxidoreductase